MFLFFEVASDKRSLGVLPESLEVLIFGVGLVLLAIGLRWLMNRTDEGVARREAEKSE